MSNKKVLLSFHGDPAIKEKYLERLRQHRKMDEIIQGTGYDGQKGCAVGCTLNNYDHNAYETELGIPKVIAYLEDRIFEKLTVEESKDFPINFLSAIPVGIDLKNVFKKFIIWSLIDPEDGVMKFAKREQTKKSIQDVVDMVTKSLTEEISCDQLNAVRKSALEARRAAYAAAAAAADGAAAAYADADGAAYAAAAAYADGAAAADADADADGAAYAAAAAAADAAAYARKNKYTRMAAKLIELLSEAE